MSRAARRAPRRALTLLGILVAALGWILASPPVSGQGDDAPLVYSRCPRTEEPITISGNIVVDGRSEPATRVLRHADTLDILPDVLHFFDGFAAPCDLVYRDGAGQERVLYDCRTRSTDADACAALDAAVSFDGRTVAFAVFRGPIERRTMQVPAKLLNPAATSPERLPVRLPNPYLRSREAQLYLVDVASGKITPMPHTAGVFDSGPAFLSDGRLAFTSNRSGQFSTLLPSSSTQRPTSEIFTMDLDGRNVDKASHHALAGEQHPLQLLDGRVAFSSWQLFGLLPYRMDGGVPGGLGTVHNKFHVFAQHPDGANLFPIFGMHTGNHGPGPSRFPIHHAAHFLAQASDGRLWVADYYRGNNMGLGQIVGFPLPPPDQEGIGPDEKPHPHDIFRPRGFTVLAPWTDGFDSFAPKTPAPELRVPTYKDPLLLAGKLSHPAGLPGGQLLLTWGLGGCSSEAAARLIETRAPFTTGGGIVAPNVLTLLGRDNPGCDTGIYRTTRIPSRHPSDLALVLNRREYHEIMARPVLPYAAIYGRERPAAIPRADLAGPPSPDLPPGTPFGVLGASSILLRETRSLRGNPFAGAPGQYLNAGLQGTDTVDYADDELCGVRILITQPNRAKESARYKTTVGERVVILGEFPVRKADAGGRPVLDSSGVPDTSFKVRFPANTPYLMQGIDCLGRTLNTDMTWQSLRAGEVKTCNGCHVHGKAGLPFAGTAAARPGFRPATLGEGSVPLLAGGRGASVQVEQKPGWGVQYEWGRDVFPILQRRCASCHSGAAAAAGLVLDAPGTGAGSTYYRLVIDRSQRHVPADHKYPQPIRKPQLTKYVRMLTARGSLLYWKALNQRADGRTDDQYGPGSPKGWEDVDFGPSHPTGITAEELAVLARWLETGTAAEAGALIDTTPPALTLAARAEGQAVAALLVGTVDVGSGIEPGSLEVCVLGADGRCAQTLIARAEPAGVTTVALPRPLTDAGAEVRARVRDRAGNVTEIRRTVAWLLTTVRPVASAAAPAASPAAARQ